MFQRCNNVAQSVAIRSVITCFFWEVIKTIKVHRNRAHTIQLGAICVVLDARLLRWVLLVAQPAQKMLCDGKTALLTVLFC